MRSSLHIPSAFKNLFTHQKTSKNNNNVTHAKTEAPVVDTPRMYIERDPARNVQPAPRNNQWNPELASPSKISIPANTALTDALTANGLRPGFIDDVDMSKPLVMELKEGKKNKKHLSSASSGDPVIRHYAMKTAPPKVLQIANFPNRSNQNQTLILHDIGNGNAGVQAILRQKDGSFTALNHSQSIPITDGKKARYTMQVGQNGETMVQSFNKKQNFASSLRTRNDALTTGHLHTPDDVIMNVLTKSHQSADGDLFKIADGQIYQFDEEQKQWQAKADTQGAKKLISSAEGKVYHAANGRLKDTSTNATLISQMPASNVLHIGATGTMLGVKPAADSQQSHHLLLGKTNQAEVTEHTLALPANSEITDVFEQQGKVWISLALHDEQGNAAGNALYKSNLTQVMDEYGDVATTQLSPPEKVANTNLGSDLKSDYKIDAFISGADGKAFVQITGNDGKHIAAFDPDSGTIGKVNGQHTASTWNISGNNVIENGKGLPSTSPTHDIRLANNTQLAIVDQGIVVKDAGTNELHTTSFGKNVSSIATDIKGKTAYALINGRIKALNVSPPTKEFSMSSQMKTSLAQSNGTTVSLAKIIPGNNINAFAAADSSLIAQMHGDGRLTALINDKHHELPSLPSNEIVTELGIDSDHNLYALTSNGKLHRMASDTLAKSAQQTTSSDSTHAEDAKTPWETIDIPENMTIKALSTGKQIKVTFEDTRGQRHELTPTEDGFKPLSAEKSSAFDDFSKRGRYYHIHEKKDKKTGEVHEELHKRQSIKTRTGNVLAHLADVPIHSASQAQNSFMKRLRGSEQTRAMAEAAKSTHAEFKALNRQLITSRDEPPAPMTQRIAQLETRAPKTAQHMRALHQNLLSQLTETLTEAGIERGVINAKTHRPQLSNQHVGKEYGGDKDIINTLNTLMTKLNIDANSPVHGLLKAFHDSDQGLMSHKAINPAQPHTLRKLQVTKEHIELIAVQLSTLDRNIMKASEAIGTATTQEAKVAVDNQQADRISKQNEEYQNHPIALQNKKGVTSYKDPLNVQNELENFFNFLDRPNSGLSRGIRSKVGAKDHEDAMTIMRNVADSIPDDKALTMSERIGTHVGYATWRLGLPQTQDKNNAIQLAAFTEVAAQLGSKHGMSLSTAPNGDLNIHLSRVKDIGVSALTAGAASVGNGKTLVQAGGAEGSDPGIQIGGANPDLNARFKILLRFQTWFEGALGTSKEKGGTLVIPADKKGAFLDIMFGGKAASQVQDLMSLAKTQTKKEAVRMNAEIGGYIAAAIRFYGDSDLSVGRDSQPYLRVQAEVDARVKFAQLDFEKLVETGRGHHHTEKTDQMFHLLPSGYIRSRIAQYHTVNLQAGDSFVYGGTPGTAENGGTGISENYDDVGNTPWQRMFLSFDNKRETKFDGTSNTAGEITKADYINAMQDLALAFKDSHPLLAGKIAANVKTMENSGDNFKEVAKPTVNTAVALLAGASDTAADDKTENSTKLNSKQLAAINVLAMVDIHKEAYDKGSTMQSDVQHTMKVSNFNRLHDEGTVNKLARKVGIGPKLDSSALLAQLMQHSPNLKNIISQASQAGGSAVLKTGFNPGVQRQIDQLNVENKLTDQILDDLLAGKGNLVKEIDGKLQVVPNAQAGKNNIVPLAIEISTSNMRERNFDTQTPFFRPGAQTSIGSSEKAMSIEFSYDGTTSGLPSSFTVQRQNVNSVPNNTALHEASKASLRVSTTS